MKVIDLIAVREGNEPSVEPSSVGIAALIEIVRVSILVLALLTVFLVLMGSAEIVNFETWTSLLAILSLGFLSHTIYLSFSDLDQVPPSFNYAVFAIDTLVFGGLYYFVGLLQPIFLFAFLGNIILAGLLMKRTGGIWMALWTSVVYSVLLLGKPELQGESVQLTVVLNNLAFFAVALLSGQLSEQLNVLGNRVKARERDVKALQQLNEMIVENIATGLLTVDSHRQVTFCNKPVLNLFGQSSLDGWYLDQLLPEVAGKMKAGELAVPAGQVNRFEVDYVGPEQERMVLEVIVSALRDQGNEVSGCVLLIQDLTEIKRMQRKMMEQDKLAAVGQLAAGIAHEIRNPLASISGSIQLLADSVSTQSEEDQKLLAITVREIDRLNGLIVEFLDYVRPHDIVEDPISVNTVLSDVVEIVKLNKDLSSEVELKVNLESKKLILGNRDKLKQALLNILINAYQAVDGVDQPEIFVHSYDRAHGVIVSIRDNGCGMDEATIKRMYEPFHTTKPRGTGLGLAITNKIFEAHGATVFVDSDVDGGTAFTIEFPIETKPHPDEMALRKQA